LWRWGRHHHYVDFSAFAGNKLIRDPAIEIADGVDDYGMRLIQKQGDKIVELHGPAG
jgi:hypothetical protein